MSRRISGSSFDVELMDELIHVEKATLTITDNTAVVTTRGIPDGWVAGDVSAEVEYEVSTRSLQFIIDQAKKVGSFRELEEHDSMFYANSGNEELKIEVFGVKLVLDSLLDVDAKGAEILTHKIKGFVTSPDFVHINGVPYLSNDDTRDLLG